jgi:hypothetical protein
MYKLNTHSSVTYIEAQTEILSKCRPSINGSKLEEKGKRGDGGLTGFIGKVQNFTTLLIVLTLDMDKS